jgi:hypothetical protein
MTEPSSTPVRRFAHPFDRFVRRGKSYGCDASPEAIGGFYSMGWTEFYRDHQTGETFCVACKDGVYGGKDAHTDTDAQWIVKCCDHIEERCFQEASAGNLEIHISPNEWSIMLGFTHAKWLESQKDAFDGKQADKAINEGLIGHCHGVPVIVDPQKQDDLPPQ